MKQAWLDPEKRKRRSEDALERYKNPEYKDKWKKAIQNSCFKKIRCVETNVVYNSLNEAAEKLNVNRPNISRSLKKGCRCGGYHWEYVNDVAS